MQIPSEIGNLPRLRHLGLQEGQFTGSVPTELGLLSSLQTIEIQGNRLTGQIPSEIAAVPDLTVFLAQQNAFSGTIPIEIEQLIDSSNSSLAFFNVTNNELVDPYSDVPFCWVDESYSFRWPSPMPMVCENAHPRASEEPACQC